MRDFERIYTYHAPKQGQQEQYKDIRAAARHLAETVEALCPEGREKSLAHTKIEEAVLWANAAIAREG